MSVTREDPPLFSKGDLAGTLQNVESTLKGEIESYEANRLLNTPVEDLVAYFVAKFLVEAISLREGDISQEHRETTVDTRRMSDGMFMYGDHQRLHPATAFQFFVPFSGDSQFLSLQPNFRSSVPPQAAVADHELVFTFVSHQTDPAEVKTAFERDLKVLKQYLVMGGRMIADFNSSLPGQARSAINTRRGRLLKAQNAASSLGYPMRRREGVPATYTSPSVRRKILSPPPASTAPFAPEPDLAVEEYEHILGILSNMTAVLERSPTSFKNMEEEDIRQHFLVQLNGHYEGNATGETFNVGGKTDILVRENGKNIFIAECKFWKGPGGFTKAIDQLLGYLSWRDTKAAIILFNRDTALSTILAKIPEGLRAHPNFTREVQIDGETRFRAVFHHRNDPSRELTVTVLVFDVPG